MVYITGSANVSTILFDPSAVLSMGEKTPKFPGWENLYQSVPLFFFQAEDGIRDGRVTGVQTCALPISFCLRLDGDRYRRTLFEDHFVAVFHGQNVVDADLLRFVNTVNSDLRFFRHSWIG